MGFLEEKKIFWNGVSESGKSHFKMGVP